MGALESRTKRHRAENDGKWRRRAMVVAALGLAFGMVNGVSGASAPTTDVNFTPVTPYKVMNSVYIAKGATKAVIVSGGNTFVPSNATTVRLTISVTGPQNGTLTFFPTGNPAGSSGDTVTWSAGGTATGTIETDIGEKNKLSVTNNSTGAADVTATLVAYSQEVEAGDISSLEGATGQVLTDTGTGAAWQTPSPAYHAQNLGYVTLTPSSQAVVNLTVPAGIYAVNATASLFVSGSTPEYGQCLLRSPVGAFLDERFANVDTNIMNNTMVLQTVLSTNGGTISLRCEAVTGLPYLYGSHITAIRVGSAHGQFVNGRTGSPSANPRMQP